MTTFDFCKNYYSSPFYFHKKTTGRSQIFTTVNVALGRQLFPAQLEQRPRLEAGTCSAKIQTDCPLTVLGENTIILLYNIDLQW